MNGSIIKQKKIAIVKKLATKKIFNIEKYKFVYKIISKKY